MIRNFLRFSRVPVSVYKQVRLSSFLYNGLQWGEQYPSTGKTAKKNIAASDLLSDVKVKVPKFIHEVEIPYSFKGTKSFRPIKRAFDKSVLDEKRTDMPRVYAKLEKYCFQYMKALSTGNILDLPPCESNFSVAVQRGLNHLHKGGFKLELRESPHELKEKGLKEGVEIFETMHIMGLNVERARNKAVEDYTMNNLEEGKGLIMYMPKVDSDDEGETKEPVISKDEPDHPSLRGHRRLIDELQLVLRVYVLYTTKYKLIPIQAGQETGLDNYSFHHVAIFENQLRMPPVGALSYSNVPEGMKKYRLQEWKMVDFDGGIRGNPMLADRANHPNLYLLNSK